MTPQFHLAAVGDVVLTRSFSAAPQLDPRFQAVLDHLESADVAFANLETVLAKTGYPREKIITLRAEPKLVDDLKAMHWDVLSLANNHTVDYGEDALLATIDLLEGNGIRSGRRLGHHRRARAGDH
jgi:poly-gamma-glutamate synthesis protein (capsule biosynthesis protein)